MQNLKQKESYRKVKALPQTKGIIDYLSKFKGILKRNMNHDLRHEQELLTSSHVLSLQQSTTEPRKLPAPTLYKSKPLYKLIPLPLPLKERNISVRPIKSNEESQLRVESKAGNLFIPMKVYESESKRYNSNIVFKDRIQEKRDERMSNRMIQNFIRKRSHSPEVLTSSELSFNRATPRLYMNYSPIENRPIIQKYKELFDISKYPRTDDVRLQIKAFKRKSAASPV